MTEPKDPSLADTLGKGYAHLQHAMDRGIEWGFRKMKDMGTAPDTVEIESPAMRKAAGIGKGLVSFLGRAGESYFRTYGDLKKKRDNPEE